MRNRSVIGLSLGKKLILTGGGMAALVLPVITGALSSQAFQAQDAPDWQAKAGGTMAFEVASVKLSAEKTLTLNVPLDAGDRFRPTGGYFRADAPLWNAIFSSPIRFGRRPKTSEKISSLVCRNGLCLIVTASKRAQPAIRRRMSFA